MPLEPYAAIRMSSPSSGTTLVVLVLVSFIYLRGWRGVRGAWVSALPAWRAASFLFGMFLVWGALGSPLVAYDHELLTVHMIQHLLLMTVPRCYSCWANPYWLSGMDCHDLEKSL